MYPNRKKMMESIIKMRDEYGCRAIKAEFEAEGSRKDELIMLTDVLRRTSVPLTLKIGGCEAARDMSQAKLFGAEAIMAPMVETAYAMEKYRATAKKVYGDFTDQVEWIVNVETGACHENLDSVLEAGEGFLDTVCIGRSDYSGSLGLSKEINGPEMLERVTDIAKRAKAAGLRVTMGGKVLPDAIPFVQAVSPYIDAFETRKVTFEVTDEPQIIADAIECAVDFETQYLLMKYRYYESMAKEDSARLEKFLKIAGE